MKAISLWQPWASLIAIGAKRYETRSWPPPLTIIGRRIAIHAAAKIISPRDFGHDSTFEEAADRALGGHGLLSPRSKPFAYLPHGVIVCTAVVDSAVRVEPGSDWSTVPPDLFGDYSAGRWVWRLRDVAPLREPLACRGRQGIFEVELPEVAR